MGIERIRKLLRPLVGKTFSTASLHREVNKIMPNAWWGSAPTPRGMCIYATNDTVYLAIQLDRTDNKRIYRVRNAEAGFELPDNI